MHQTQCGKHRRGPLRTREIPLAGWRWLVLQPPTPAHLGDVLAQACTGRDGAPAPYARGRRTQRDAGQGPVFPHHRRTREGHQRRAPGSRSRPRTDSPLPPATPYSLLLPGTGAAEGTTEEHTA